MKGHQAGWLHPTFFRGVFWALLLFVTAMAWLPVENPSLTQSHGDKINHIGAFAVLTIFAFRAYGPPLARGAVMLLGYGALVEAVQLALPYRTFSPLDIVADALGILAGWALFLLHARFMPVRPGSARNR